MAEKNDGGDKTEKPTPKRLKDARKKGDIPKSKDVTSTLELGAWVLVLSLGCAYAGERLAGLFEATLAAVARGQDFMHAVTVLGAAAGRAFLELTLLAFVPAVVVGVCSEVAQTGGLITFEKLTPSLDKLNPIEGFKRMFSMDNLVEVIKNIIKVTLIGLLTWIVLKGSLREIMSLISSAPIGIWRGEGIGQASAIVGLSRDLAVRMLSWTLGVFLLVSIVDLVYQKSSFTKKMKMSVRDIKQEHKENEGDPHVKGHRRQLAHEWAQTNAVGRAGTANVLVTNPTHVAVALDYNRETCPVPVVAAMGEGPLAARMREAAKEAGVPIVQHVELARALYRRADTGDFVPREMFEAVAQVILWARKLRDEEAVDAKADRPEPQPDEAAA